MEVDINSTNFVVYVTTLSSHRLNAARSVIQVRHHKQQRVRRDEVQSIVFIDTSKVTQLNQRLPLTSSQVRFDDVS